MEGTKRTHHDRAKGAKTFERTSQDRKYRIEKTGGMRGRTLDGWSETRIATLVKKAMPDHRG
jgi:hypothetical protein